MAMCDLKFYDYGGGSVFQVAASLNGVTYTATTTVAPPSSTSGSSQPSESFSKNGGASTLIAGDYMGMWMGMSISVAFGLLGAWGSAL